MARKRMFSLDVVDTDSFLEMPVSARLLYYDLGMRADDDGFVDNWKKILLFTGLKEDDLKILITKQFIIPFETGIIVIKHWRMNNYLQNDRVKKTIHQNELKQLKVNESSVYTLDTTCIHSIDKNSIEENRLDKSSIDNILPKRKKEINKELYVDIIGYLNAKTGSNYKATTPKTKQLIQARMNEGFTLDDFKIVIDKKCLDWLRNNDMKKYLRPETLFGTKFESYLNQPAKEITTKDIPAEYLDIWN